MLQPLMTSWVAILAFAQENPPFTSLPSVVATTETRKRRRKANRNDGSLLWNLVVMLNQNLML